MWLIVGGETVGKFQKSKLNWNGKQWKPLQIIIKKITLAYLCLIKIGTDSKDLLIFVFLHFIYRDNTYNRTIFLENYILYTAIENKTFK